MVLMTQRLFHATHRGVLRVIVSSPLRRRWFLVVSSFRLVLQIAEAIRCFILFSPQRTLPSGKLSKSGYVNS